MRAVLLATLLAAAPAHAGDNDLVLARLAEQVGSGASARSVGQSVEFRALASELGVALAPRLLAPTDTLGFSGFQLSTDVAFTSVDADARHWRARVGAGDPAGGTSNGGGSLTTVGVFARKGWWFPLPSFEAGAGAVHLQGSNLWAAQGYARLALHEGYHRLPLPSLAVRGAASRLFGERDLGLTVASLDATVGKDVGVGGTWTFSPYAGWNLLWILATSEVLDPTPAVDPLDPATPQDRLLNFVFREQDPITRQRLVIGAKLRYDAVSLTIEGQHALAGSSVDDQPGTTAACTLDADTDVCDTTDTAAAQTTVALSVGVEF